MKTLYTAHAVTVAGREGHAETDDKQLSVTLSKPGSGKPGVNPEQLFAVGYGACFGGAVEAVARQRKVTVSEVKVQAEVNLNQDNEGGYFISAALNVTLPGVEDAVAREIVTAAHQMCPYSKAVRGNIEVTLNANGAPLAQAA